jgi:type II secretory pathway pseudopilin PulG
MNLPLHHPNRSNSDGITILVVLIGILVISVLATAVLLGQKNLFTVVQKVENQTIQLDVANLCLNIVVKDLIDKSSKKTLSISATNYVDVTTLANVAVNGYANQIAGSISNVNPGAITVKNQYAGTAVTRCRYIYLFQRPVTNGVLGGEIAVGRSYGSNIILENVYKVEVITCGANISPCNSIRTESFYYVGIQ